MKETPVKIGLTLLGEELEPIREACLYLDNKMEITSIEHTCPSNSIGSPAWVLLPAPANAHTHLGDSAFPEYNTVKGLEELVKPPNGLKHRLLSRLSPGEFKASYRKTLAEARKTGTGIIIDYREGGPQGCRIARQAYSEVGTPPRLFLHGRPSAREEIEAIASECDGYGLPSPLDYTEEELKEIYRIATMHGLPVSAHIAETPTARREGDLEKLLDAGKPAYIVHGIYLSEDDIMLLSQKDIPVASSPSSNLFHGLDMPPLKLFYTHEIRVAWGTDNAAWNPPNPWREAWLAYLLGRGNGLREVEYAKWVLKGLFFEGYKITGLKPPVIGEGHTLYAVVVNGGSWAQKTGDPYAAILKRISESDIVAFLTGYSLPNSSISQNR